MSFIKSNFFVISKDDDLTKIQSKIYGYQLHHGKDKLGHYVKISCNIDWINISVDQYGMGIVFEYKSDDYWAISNSFYLLTEYISKKNKPLSINQEYLNLFAKINAITTVTYSETLFKEISIVPSNRELRIFKTTKGLIYKDFKEEPHLPMGSAESLEYIDKWANKWISVIKSLVDSGNQINLQLSGGFDSRLVLALILAAKIDFSKINVESSKSMPEDLGIAEEIAKFYGFKVNNGLIEKFKHSVISKEDQYNINMYFRGGLHKEFLPPTHYKFYEKPLFILAGYGNMRGWFNDTPERYIRFLIKNKYVINEDIDKSLENIVTKAINNIYTRMNFDIPKGKNFMNFVYNYTRGRYNYGSSVMASASVNQYILSPILDLECINPTSELYGDDFNLLFAYIYERFAPDLLKFRFNNNRAIPKQTIETARKLNARQSFIVINQQNATTFETQNNTKIKNLGLRKKDLRERILDSFENAEVNIVNKYIGNVYLNLAKEEFDSKIRHNEKGLFCLHSLAESIKNSLHYPKNLMF